MFLFIHLCMFVPSSVIYCDLEVSFSRLLVLENFPSISWNTAKFVLISSTGILGIPLKFKQNEGQMSASFSL